MSTTNSEPFVIPYGGIGHALGTNPIALAAPTPDGIFDTDMATSQVAVNRIFNARDEGREIPEGWGVDEQGQTTTDPAEVFAAVPLGGYKGYALARARRGALRGAVGLRGRTRRRAPLRGRASRRTSGTSTSRSTPGGSPAASAPPSCWAGCSRDLKAIPPAPGDDEVLVPGEPEARAKAERERDGIPLPPTLWTTLEDLSGELGVSPPGR